MTNANFFIAEPAKFKQICQVYPPLVKDMITNDNFSIYRKILTISAEEIYDDNNESPIDSTPNFTAPLEFNQNFTPRPLKQTVQIKDLPTPLEYLLINCYHNRDFLKLTLDAFEFFTHTSVVPLYEEKAFYVGTIEDLKNYKTITDIPMLNNENFLTFQNLVREACGIDVVEPPVPNEDPRITRMKAKARYRDKIKAQSGSALNFETTLVAICCMGIGITPLNIGELSYNSVSKIMTMYQNKESYELDTQALMAGADPKKVKPKYWITNL